MMITRDAALLCDERVQGFDRWPFIPLGPAAHNMRGHAFREPLEAQQLRHRRPE
jgi:hypothetical protein